MVHKINHFKFNEKIPKKIPLDQYFLYPSIIATKENHTGYMFPKIRVCHNSMHSKRKVDSL